MHRKGLITFLIVLLGCEEPIEFDTSRDGGLLIEARLVYDVLGSDLILKARDVSSGEGIRIDFFELISENGTRIPMSSFVPSDELRIHVLDNQLLNFTNSYQLIIFLSNGEIIVSDLEKIILVPLDPTFTFEVFERIVEDGSGGFLTENYIKYYISSSLTNCNGDRVGLKWDFYKVFRRTDLLKEGEILLEDPSEACYYLRELNPSSIQMIDKNEIESDVIENFPVIEDVLDWDYAEGLNFYVVQEGLSTGANEYFNQIKVNGETQGGLFDPPFANPESNMVSSNSDTRVFGYFYASQIDTVNRFITPEEVNRPSSICFLFTPDEYDTSPPFCQRCDTDSFGLIAKNVPAPELYTRPSAITNAETCE